MKLDTDLYKVKQYVTDKVTTKTASIDMSRITTEGILRLFKSIENKILVEDREKLSEMTSSLTLISLNMKKRFEEFEAWLVENDKMPGGFISGGLFQDGIWAVLYYSLYDNWLLLGFMDEYERLVKYTQHVKHGEVKTSFDRIRKFIAPFVNVETGIYKTNANKRIYIELFDNGRHDLWVSDEALREKVLKESKG